MAASPATMTVQEAVTGELFRHLLVIGPAFMCQPRPDHLPLYARLHELSWPELSKAACVGRQRPINKLHPLRHVQARTCQATTLKAGPSSPAIPCPTGLKLDCEQIRHGSQFAHCNKAALVSAIWCHLVPSDAMGAVAVEATRHAMQHLACNHECLAGPIGTDWEGTTQKTPDSRLPTLDSCASFPLFHPACSPRRRP